MHRPSDIDWYIQRNGCEHGPLTLLELRIFLSHGHSKPADLFRYQYRTNPQHSGYLAASAIDEFQELEAGVQTSEHASAASEIHDWSTHLGAATIMFQAVFDQIASIFVKLWVLMVTPERFGRRWIEPCGTSSLRGALSFFTTCFSIAFIILTFTSKFSYYTGESEIRVLMKISLQLLIGIIVLYAFVRMFRSNIQLTAMGSLILYFDGIFLLFSAITHGFVKAVQSPGFLGVDLEKDLYANLFESCVAGRSPMYWLVRGDLEFFISSTNGTTYTRILEYSHLVIAIACICLIARVFKIYYKPHVSIFVACASVTFVLVSEGYSYGEEKLKDYLASKNSNCWSSAAEETARRYKSELVTPQLLINLRREIREMSVTDRRFVDIVFPNISLVKNDFLVQAVLPAHVINSSDQRLVEIAQRFAIASYCHDSSYFRLARALNVHLFWTLTDETGRPVKLINIDTTNCQTE